jgi:RNA polymerase sigma-70 factor, ECF subfamily
VPGSSCLRRNHPGPYQIQAAISAVHSDASSAAATDWPQILRLYDQLLAITPTPVVALDRYYLFHAVRADLLRRLGRTAEALDAYDSAIARAGNAAERTFLQRRRAEVTG